MDPLNDFLRRLQNPKAGMSCMNCGKRPAAPGELICKDCADAAKAIPDVIELGYSDGTTKKVKLG